TSPTPTFLADVSGDFTACLRVSNSLGCESDPHCVQITAAPVEVDLHIELVWFEKGSDEISGTSDLDLHFQAPPYAASRWYTGNPMTRNSPVAWWRVRNPDWGGTPLD